MQYRCHIKGFPPGCLFANGFSAIDKASELAQEKQAILDNRGKATAADRKRLREIQCLQGFYSDTNGRPTVPPQNIRAMLETAARRIKEGPLVREGLIVTPDVELRGPDWTKDKTIQELSPDPRIQHRSAVKTSGGRSEHCRPHFEEWELIFVVDCYEDMVDQRRLTNWLQIAGRRIGFGDWRPEKSGAFGRFEVLSVEEVPD